MSKAQRVVIKASEFGDSNHFQGSAVVALATTQAANGTLFSFRWGSTTHTCTINSIKLALIQTAAATATIMPNFEVFVARSFSVSDSIGAALTLTTNSFKKRASNSITLVTDIRKATIAAGLTAGTRTLDASPILQMPVNLTVTTPNAVVYKAEKDYVGNAPLILGVNEGFIVRGPSIVFGAADTADLAVEIEWSETINANV